MPEILVFARVLVLGFALAEIFRVAYIGGSGLAGLADRFDPVLRFAVAAIVFAMLAW